MFRKFWDNLFSSSYSYFSITFCTWKIVILSTVMREKRCAWTIRSNLFKVVFAICPHHRERTETVWLRFGIMFQSGTKCLSIHCYFSERTLSIYNATRWPSTKQISSCEQRITDFPHTKFKKHMHTPFSN